MTVAADLHDSAISIRALSIDFGPLKALDQVSFDIPRGSITGLIGRNGAGKTTCIRCLAGLLDPAGTTSPIRVFGLSPDSDRRQILAACGFLLNESALFSYLTPIETLAFIGRAYGLSPTTARGRALQLIGSFDLEDAANRIADNFSTGMRKRLAIAASLIHAPRALILDEPFESLDPLMVRSLKKLLRDYAAGGGTVLLSSHLIDAVEEICDRVVILEQGRVVASGPTDTVRATIADRLPEATLEDLYASLVPAAPAPILTWLVTPEDAL